MQLDSANLQAFGGGQVFAPSGIRTRQNQEWKIQVETRPTVQIAWAGH